jgi:hypothetical protein
MYWFRWTGQYRIYSRINQKFKNHCHKTVVKYHVVNISFSKAYKLHNSPAQPLLWCRQFRHKLFCMRATCNSALRMRYVSMRIVLLLIAHTHIHIYIYIYIYICLHMKHALQIGGKVGEKCYSELTLGCCFLIFTKRINNAVDVSANKVSQVFRTAS